MQEAKLFSNILGEITEDPLKLYSFKEKLGSGNFGVVHRVVQLASGKEFACKLIRKSELTSSVLVKWVRQEIKIMRRLAKSRHPNIVALEGVYEDPSFVYLVMELCNRGELYHYICGKDFLMEAEAAQIFSEIAAALAFCHENSILHRDVKPENILLHKSDGPPSPAPGDDATARLARVQVKLADFGLAVSLGSLGQTAGSAGSRHYEAPEVMGGDKYGTKADSWSLGITLYAMLCGRLPFLGKTPSTLLRAMRESNLEMDREPWPRVSPPAKSLVRRLLMVDPARRLSLEAALKDPWLAAQGVRTEVTKAILSPLPPHPPLPPRAHYLSPSPSPPAAFTPPVAAGGSPPGLPISFSPVSSCSTHILPHPPPSRSHTPPRFGNRARRVTQTASYETTPPSTAATSGTTFTSPSTADSRASSSSEGRSRIQAPPCPCPSCVPPKNEGEEVVVEDKGREGKAGAGGCKREDGQNPAEDSESLLLCCWGVHWRQRGGKVNPLNH